MVRHDLHDYIRTRANWSNVKSTWFSLRFKFIINQRPFASGWCRRVPPLCPPRVWRAGAALLWGSRGGEDLLQQVPRQELRQGRLPHQVGILQSFTCFYYTLCLLMICNQCQYAGSASILSTCLGSTKCCPVLELIGGFILPHILSNKNTKWWSNIRALDYESHDL